MQKKEDCFIRMPTMLQHCRLETERIKKDLDSQINNPHNYKDNETALLYQQNIAPSNA